MTDWWAANVVPVVSAVLIPFSLIGILVLVAG